MTTDLVFADVSEYQGAVDWAAYAAGGYPAAVARVSYGTTHVDLQADRNIDGMRASLPCRGFYGYLVASEDPAAQAAVFCRVLAAHGGLKPGEFVAVDVEEGSGNQEPRAAAWLAAVNQTLHVTAQQDVEYSGLDFVATHGGWVPGVTRWVAAYQTVEPQVDQTLWQCTDAHSFPGITGLCDASVFNGTVDDLLALVTPQEDPMPERVYVCHTAQHYFVYNVDRGWRIDVATASDGTGFTDAYPQGVGLPVVADEFSEAQRLAIPARTGSVA